MTGLNFLEAYISEINKDGSFDVCEETTKDFITRFYLTELSEIQKEYVKEGQKVRLKVETGAIEFKTTIWI